MGAIAKRAAFAIALAALCCLSPSLRAEPLQIRIGWATTPSHVQPIIDALQKAHPELFPEFGKSYVARGLRFQGSTPQIEALASNELEIAAFSPSAFDLAVLNAHLDLRIVADVFQDGYPDYGTVSFAVRADGPIKRVEDLRGHILASNAIGSFGDSAMRVVLRQHGIADKDVTTVQANFANMPAMLEAGKVDLINLVPQFDYLIGEGKVRVLFTARDGQGVLQAQFWAMRADFVAAHRPALIDFFTDHIRALHWLLDPAHHDAAVALAQEVTKAPLKSIGYVFTHQDNFRSPDAVPNIASVQKSIDQDVKLGIVPQTITVAPHYVDLSLIQAAKTRLDGK